MIFALLDHPWPLEATLDGNSDGYQVLREFDRLAKKHTLRPVPFVSQTEYDQVWDRIDHSRYAGRALAQLHTVASQFVRSLDGDCLAAPSQGPADLSQDWKAALREAAADDWRNPQIVISAKRRPDWPYGDEVEIQFEPCDNEPVRAPVQRILAVLDSYEEHPFAKSDFDPWDLRRRHPPSPTAPPHLQHPCLLPKPPMEDAALDHLGTGLVEARRGAWGSTGKYYFVPDIGWKLETIEKETWRAHRSFPYRRCQHRDASGYIDFEGREWVWDDPHRHWDVQLSSGGYKRISHTGEELP